MIRRLFGFGITLLFVFFLGGCAQSNQNSAVPNDPRYAPKNPIKPRPNSYAGGSIYQKHNYHGMYADTVAHRVGDILTIILSEKNMGQKRARTNLRKDSRNSLRARFRGFDRTSQVRLPEVTVDNDRDFRSNADSTQSNTLKGRITVSVAEVQSNGNLLVQGEKWIKINRGREYIRLTGIVRPEDITKQNTVLSTQVGNARIQYSGTGQFSDTNKPGWLTRFFMGL